MMVWPQHSPWMEGKTKATFMGNSLVRTLGALALSSIKLSNRHLHLICWGPGFGKGGPYMDPSPRVDGLSVMGK